MEHDSHYNFLPLVNITVLSEPINMLLFLYFSCLLSIRERLKYTKIKFWHEIVKNLKVQKNKSAINIL